MSMNSYFFKRLFRKEIKFIKRAFGRQKNSWSDKKYMSNHVFEKYINVNAAENNVSKIYYLGSFRADGKYLLRIKKVLQSGKYYKISWLNKGYSGYVEDDLGYVPYGDRVAIFLIQYADDNFRMIAELREVPEWQKLYTDPYKFSTLFDCRNIPKTALSSIYCKEKIYPID